MINDKTMKYGVQYWKEKIFQLRTQVNNSEN